MAERRRPGEILESSLVRLSSEDRKAFLLYLARRARAENDEKALRALKDYDALQSERAENPMPA